MIKFFRRIRQRLLSENKFSKYLLYALGEIVLVVIGILIALQINGWNNERIESIKEKKVLQELKTGFELDLELIKRELVRTENALIKIRLLQEKIGDKNYKYSVGLDTLFGAVYGVRNVRLTRAFYEDLKASGLGLIKDDSIRLNVVKLFEDNYEFIEGMRDMESNINEITRPYYLNHFKDIAFTQKATPNDFDQVWNDPYYKNVIHYRIISLESNQKRIYERTIPLLNGLIQQIDRFNTRGRDH